MNDYNDYTLLREKISYFKEKNILVHVTKNNGRFHNGLILQFAGDMFILDEEVVGAIPIYLMEVKDIEKRREKE